ncbi:hypothetical protein TEA_014812 [Camellia sinensis var. sinensis]|uniref:Selenoprotein K n=1 Tax=Camellia sinensis var. sinensis TaxID=542762 RepID=A0A4S4EHW8_CAMSN|nr:hypothetical protein TEA_014812 [Camellia sinensis var. sinensis]
MECNGIDQNETRYGARVHEFPNWKQSTFKPITGVVKSKRSIWRLRTLADFFWAIVNIIGVYFATMFSEEKSDTYRKGKASGKKWDGGGPGGPGSGPSGGGPRGPARGLDNVPFLPVVPAVAEGLEISLSICNGVLNAWYQFMLF